jgi:hypothetical protein
MPTSEAFMCEGPGAAELVGASAVVARGEIARATMRGFGGAFGRPLIMFL